MSNSALHIALANALATSLQGPTSPAALDPWSDMPLELKGQGVIIHGNLRVIIEMLVEQYESEQISEDKQVSNLGIVIHF